VCVELIDEGQVGLDGEPHARIGEALGDIQLFAVGGEDELLAEDGEVVLAVGVLDVSHEERPLADEVAASAEQVAGLAESFGIDVGEREVAAAKKSGEFVGVEFVVLGLAAVDGLEIESMP